MNGHTFYMSMECDSCGESILMGLCLTAVERNGHPVIPFDFAAQETFHCDCGAAFVTGDFEAINEDEL